MNKTKTIFYTLLILMVTYPLFGSFPRSSLDHGTYRLLSRYIKIGDYNLFSNLSHFKNIPVAVNLSVDGKFMFNSPEKIKFYGIKRDNNLMSIFLALGIGDNLERFLGFQSVFSGKFRFNTYSFITNIRHVKVQHKKEDFEFYIKLARSYCLKTNKDKISIKYEMTYLNIYDFKYSFYSGVFLAYNCLIQEISPAQEWDNEA